MEQCWLKNHSINIVCPKLLYCFINQFFFPVLVAFAVMVSSLLLSSRYFATMATWRHTFLYKGWWCKDETPWKESGFRNQRHFFCRIRNLRKFCLWNPESWVCGIPNRSRNNDLNPESKLLFQRLESIYIGVEKLRKFVHNYRTWISISYIHNCFNRKLDNS